MDSAQGAIFHGLATLLSQPSPVPSRGPPPPGGGSTGSNGTIRPNAAKSVSYGDQNNQPTYQNNPAFPMEQQLHRPPGPFYNRQVALQDQHCFQYIPSSF